MNYNLNDLQASAEKTSTWSSLKKLLHLIAHERRNLVLALIAIIINSTLNLLGPLIIGRTIDHYIFVAHKDYHGVLVNCAILLCMYLVALLTSYQQTILMGG
ncbi:MAG: ABC transporter ATP-binding protein, partial [Mucilaginibacter sp.]